MVKGRDITGDLGKLRDRGVLPSGKERPVSPPALEERQPGTNLPGIFFWSVIGGCLVLQFVFLIWLSR
ncbi:MAG: hypothetical protein R6V45_04760 [Oceanipulchritudo sp.]